MLGSLGSLVASSVKAAALQLVTLLEKSADRDFVCNAPLTSNVRLSVMASINEHLRREVASVVVNVAAACLGVDCWRGRSLRT